MDKRGQIYILAAILLGVAIFTLSVQVNKYSKEHETEDFKDLSNMFTTEGSKLANSVVLQGGDLESSFRNFTVMFTSYSKSQNPDYGLIYALPYQDSNGNNITYVGNFLDQYVIVSYYTSGGNIEYKELPGCLDTISPTLIFEGLTLSNEMDLSLLKSCSLIINQKVDQVSLTIDGTGYVFQIKQDKPELVVVSREYLGELSKVYFQGDVIESKEDTAVSNSEYCTLIKSQADCIASDLCVWRGVCELGSCNSYTKQKGCEKDPRCYWQCTYSEGSFYLDCECISMEEVPKCSDGTLYNTCSSSGMYCNSNGQLQCKSSCCNSNKECVNGNCVIKTCTLKTCAADYPNKCGTFSNNCGGYITCTCSSGYTCQNTNCVSSTTQKANLVADYVITSTQIQSGKTYYYYTLTISETNGVGVKLTKGRQCFGSTGCPSWTLRNPPTIIAPNGQFSGSGNWYSPASSETMTLQYEGIDNYEKGIHIEITQKHPSKQITQSFYYL